MNKLVEYFKKHALIAASLILLASFINLTIKLFTNDSYSLTNIFNDIVLYITQFFAVIIVVIPEGLPLVITLSLAYSVSSMKDDGLLIKRLDSPEVNATIN